MDRRRFMITAGAGFLSTILTGCEGNREPAEVQELRNLYSQLIDTAEFCEGRYNGLPKNIDLNGKEMKPEDVMPARQRYLHEMRYYMYAESIVQIVPNKASAILGKKPEDFRAEIFEKYKVGSEGFSHDRFDRVFSAIYNFVKNNTDFSNDFCREVRDNTKGKTLDQIIEYYLREKGYSLEIGTSVVVQR